MDLYEAYTSPKAMEPLFPENLSGNLERMALEFTEKAARLSGAMNPVTRDAIADFLRPMNSYYSNLIEGRDTHPIDISKALRNDYSRDKAKRDLQMEAHAHIMVNKKMSEEFKTKGPENTPFSPLFLKALHRDFYEHLPDTFRYVKSKEGETMEVVPGEFRTSEVQVGRHIAPHFKSLHLFMEKFENFYDPNLDTNGSLIRRIISIAASHHRLAWIHPFLDGNGRVVRLFSDACFMHEGLHADGLWSISRGLARSSSEYMERLANADHQRHGDFDGRGNLSNKYLIEFCEYFLATAIDQVDFMYKSIDTENMLNRISGFVEWMAARNKMKAEAKYILSDAFIKGRIAKSDAMRITGTSDKTLKLIAESLIEMDLLTAKKEGVSMMYYPKYPIDYSAWLFPGFYPSDKERDMVREMQK